MPCESSLRQNNINLPRNDPIIKAIKNQNIIETSGSSSSLESSNTTSQHTTSGNYNTNNNPEFKSNSSSSSTTLKTTEEVTITPEDKKINDVIMDEKVDDAPPPAVGGDVVVEGEEVVEAGEDNNNHKNGGDDGGGGDDAKAGLANGEDDDGNNSNGDIVKDVDMEDNEDDTTNNGGDNKEKGEDSSSPSTFNSTSAVDRKVDEAGDDKADSEAEVDEPKLDEEAKVDEGINPEAMDVSGDGDDASEASDASNAGEGKEGEKSEAENEGGKNEVTSDNDVKEGEGSPSAKDESENNKSEVKKDGGEDEKQPDSPVSNLPILTGTLAYSDRDNLRRHIIRGNWKYESSHAVPPQRFELLRTIPPEEELKELPKDGEFSGSFNVQHAIKTSKGKIKMKNRAVPESGVKLTFKPKEDGDDTVFSVNGTGTNEYGVFELFGTATKNTDVEEGEDPTYSISVHKKYVAGPPAPPAGASPAKSKDKKRKHADALGDVEAKPPPTELPTEGVCLRGKLVRNTSDELSLDNAAVHRITGLWAMKRSIIEEEPDKCEKFEYEHKCSGDSIVFPLSGRYTGFFYVSEVPGERTKIAERDVTLKFRENNEGYHNVEGRGSNIYGKYSITGTLDKEGTITLFRHFQAPKVKANKKSSTTNVKLSAPKANGGNTKAPKATAAATPAPSALLTFDDVNAPKGDEAPAPLSPPEQFTAVSRGILKIENDGTHTCSGSWAMSNEHYSNGLTSKYHFGIVAHDAAEDAKAMLDRMQESGLDKDDDRNIKNLGSNGVSPVSLANSTFPIDSTQYKGSFKMRKGTTRTTTIVDQQIVLKYVKNSSGSYNVYGKGQNEMGIFDLVGTLILQGKSNGLMQLYRLYPTAPTPEPAATGTKKSSKVFQGGLTEKATPANSGPAPAMKPPERFIPSTSGLLRRESSRMSRLPSRLEEDDPQAQMDRCMEKCRQILKEIQEIDTQKIFAAPVDPISLGIPTYFHVIKDPMDLGTIQKKLDNEEIDSPEEFARLVRLTFENAIKFNTMPDNIVHVTARNLLVVFIKKFGTTDKVFNAAKKNRKLTKAERQELRRKEKEAAKEAKRKAKEEKERKRKAEVEASNESKRMKLEHVLAANKSTMSAIAQAAPNDPNANVSRAEYNLLVQAVKQLQDQIAGLHKLVKKSSKSSSSGSTAVSTGMSHYDASDAYSVQPSKPKKKKAKKEVTEPTSPVYQSPETYPTQAPMEEDLQPLSFEEQEALSESINLLPERLLPGAMQIIRESEIVDDDDDEIDLDIDQLDTKTQRKLQKFVMQVRLTTMPDTHCCVCFFCQMRTENIVSNLRRRCKTERQTKEEEETTQKAQASICPSPCSSPVASTRRRGRGV